MKNTFNLPNDFLLEVEFLSTSRGTIVTSLTVSCASEHHTGINTALLKKINSLHLRPHDSSKLSVKQILDTPLPSSFINRSLRNTISDEDLLAIGNFYNKCIENDLYPTKLLTTWLGVTRITASRYIKMARDRSYIPFKPKSGRPFAQLP